MSFGDSMIYGFSICPFLMKKDVYVTVYERFATSVTVFMLAGLNVVKISQHFVLVLFLSFFITFLSLVISISVQKKMLRKEEGHSFFQ